jgi:hypothetical protein
MIVSCNSGGGMMQGGGQLSPGMGDWNWVQIFISLGAGFLLGYFFCKVASGRTR